MSGIDFWFEFGSTYTYLAVARLRRLADQAGVAVTWKPFLLMPLLVGQGMTQDRLIGTTDNICAALAAAGQDPDAAIARAKSPQIKDGLKRQTEEAQGLGLFGSPTFLVDREMFWGDDRLEQALGWAATH